jgi:hypothetical protein
MADARIADIRGEMLSTDKGFLRGMNQLDILLNLLRKKITRSLYPHLFHLLKSSLIP